MKLLVVLFVLLSAQSTYAREFGDTSYGQPGDTLLNQQQNYEAKQYQEREYQARQSYELQRQHQQIQQQQYENNQLRQQQQYQYNR